MHFEKKIPQSYEIRFYLDEPLQPASRILIFKPTSKIFAFRATTATLEGELTKT